MRAEIQRQALRLFREQGYEATTVSQIAAAAEVSESSFFRYFANKEDVVRWDAFDPQIIEVFKAQPTTASPIQALRVAFRDVLARLSAGEQEEVRRRLALTTTILPLRGMLLDPARAAPGPALARAANLAGAPAGGSLRLLAEALAERTGRTADDPAVRTFLGAVMGVCLSALFAAAGDPAADIVGPLDDALARLEAGLPL